MRLKELLNGVRIIKNNISLEENISFPTSDSRKTKKDGAFIAIKGENRNGNDYIYNAIELGAKCIITDDDKVYGKFQNCILVESSRPAIAYIWNNFYSNPVSSMKIIGITGTNGKTSCAYFLYSILRAANKKVGLISTIECLVNDVPYNSNGGSDVSDLYSAMTTPDPEVLYYIFSKMRDEGIEYVVMEASSHSLELSKLAPIHFLAGIFTNLSCEHLDFHKDMASYFNSKMRLFSKCELGIINEDDNYGGKIAKEKPCVCFSLSKEEKSDFNLSNLTSLDNGISYDLKYNGKKISVICKISGEFSAYNSALAFACAIKLGINEKDALKGVFDLESISGRMEKVVIDENIFIDYAHTPYALEKILKTVKDMGLNNRIIALFGCGGDRDKTKRAQMGKIASEMADIVIITSDNSRNESLVKIIGDILSGIERENFVVIPRRRDAIIYALTIKEKQDVLLLLGKGHELYEINKTGKHYFSEKEIVKEFLNYDKNNSDFSI